VAWQAEMPELGLETTGRCQPGAGGRPVPAGLLRSGAGDTTRRKKTQKGFGRLATKRLPKSATCGATRCITWQSGRTTRPAPAPPAPPSTSPPESPVSVGEGGGLGPGRVSASTLQSEGAVRLFFCCQVFVQKTLPAFFYVLVFLCVRLFPVLGKQSMQN